MTIYSAKVVVEYYFDFEGDDYGIDNLKDAEDYAYYHFDEFAYSAEVYSVDVDEEPYADDEEESNG